MARSKRPVTFVHFAERVLRLTFTPAQRVLARVALDGVDPADLLPEERELARQLFGEIDRVPQSARRIVTALCGRGSGKSTLGAAWALYRSLTADLGACGPGDVPVYVTIAPDKRTAALSIRMARELARGANEIDALITAEGADGFTLRRPDRRLVAVEAFAASRGGASARGRSIVDFTLDEAQFFRSDDGGGAFVVNDRDIYQALVPRLMRGGKGLLLSTPWPTPTLMGDLFAANFGSPTTALAAKAPTSLMRAGDEGTAEVIAMERARDPDNAAREFDCDTSIGGGETYFDATAIARATDATPLPIPRVAHHQYAAGADFGFRSDSSAIVVASFDGSVYRVAASLELRPRKGEPLKPSSVVATFAELAKQYGVSGLVSDAHYREAIAEALEEHGLYILDAPTGQAGKTETFARVRSVLNEGRLRLPDDARLLAQLRDVRSKPTPGGGMSIVQPRRSGGGHGDVASALVLAVHALRFATVTEPKPTLRIGSPEWCEAQRDRRQRELRDRLERTDRTERITRGQRWQRWMR
jgi:hypothetical protein